MSHFPTVKTPKGVQVVQLSGEIDVLTAPPIEEYLESLTCVPHPDLVMDLREVTFIDCRGVSLLCKARRLVGEQDGRLRLLITDPRILRILRVTGLAEHFTICDELPWPRGVHHRPLHRPTLAAS